MIQRVGRASLGHPKLLFSVKSFPYVYRQQVFSVFNVKDILFLKLSSD